MTIDPGRGAGTGPRRDRKGATLVISLLDCDLGHVTYLDAVVPHL